MNPTHPTLLLFTAHHLLGRPLRARSDGECHWPCPLCGSDDFHTRPVHPKFKDTCSCWGCRWWGDVGGLLEAVYPDATSREITALFTALVEAWQGGADPYEPLPTGGPTGAGPALVPAVKGHMKGPSCSLPLRGGAEGCKADARALARAWDGLSEAERDLLILALAVAEREGVPLQALADACEANREYWAAREAEHLAECASPEECDDWPCRMARGLEPLTPEQVKTSGGLIDWHRFRPGRKARKGASHGR